MKNFTKELKAILKEDPGAPIMSPDEVVKRANTMVILTNQAPPKLLALAGSSRKAILLNFKPLMITFPDQKGVYKVQPDDIVFENHHSGRDVTEAGAEETSYEKFFASAMKKFGVSSPIELNPEDTKKFFNYVDKNWDAEEESDGSKTEILPAIGAAVGGLARGAMAVGRGVAGAAGAAGALGGDDETEDTNEIAPAIAAGLGAVGAGAAGKVMDKISGDENEGIIGSLVKGALGGTAKKAATGLKKVGVKDPASFAKGAAAGYVATKALGSNGKNKETEPHAHTTHTHEDVTTGKVGKKDKGSYRRAYKLALKKYQIHSADELDTPAERKGFTAYVDRLWKDGEVHEDNVEEVSSEEKARRKEAERKERERREKTQAANVKKRVPGSEKTAAEKDREKLADLRKRDQETLARKLEQNKKRREQEQQSKEREKEKDSPKPDSPKPPKPEKKTPKKRSGGLGIGSALKDLGRYTVAKAQSAGGN